MEPLMIIGCGCTMENEKLEEVANVAASRFHWQGIVNRLRNYRMAYRLGFTAGATYRSANPDEQMMKVIKLLEICHSIFKRYGEVPSKLRHDQIEEALKPFKRTEP